MPKGTINLQVTTAHLDKALAARKNPAGYRQSLTCIVAQALAEVIPDFDGCSAQTFTYGGDKLPGNDYRSRPLVGDLGGARVLVSYYDSKRYDDLRALLPITIAATFREDENADA